MSRIWLHGFRRSVLRESPSGHAFTLSYAMLTWTALLPQLLSPIQPSAFTPIVTYALRLYFFKVSWLLDAED